LLLSGFGAVQQGWGAEAVAGFGNAVQRARIKDFRFHDLHHTYASWAVQNGMDLYRLSRILGHATMAMTAKYAHLQTDDLHVAVQAVAKRMAQKARDSAPPRAGQRGGSPTRREGARPRPQKRLASVGSMRYNPTRKRP
jgi:hypothetical protein